MNIFDELDVILSNKSEESIKLNKNFWKWFDESKIVDDKGKPLIMYHGSNKIDRIKVFKPSKEGFCGDGIYFMDNFGDALYFGSDYISVYLSIKNPFIIHEDDIDIFNEFPEPYKKYLNVAGIDSKILKKFGYDGVMLYRNKKGYEGNIYVVAYESNQIKSVHNKGTWDFNSDNIYE